MQADDQCEVVSGIIAISNVYLCDKVKKNRQITRTGFIKLKIIQINRQV